MGQLGIHGMVAARDAELQLMVDYFAELPARIEKMTGAQLFKAARLLGWMNANAAKGCASRYNERGNYIIYTTKSAAVDCIIGEILRRGNDDNACRLSVEEDGRGGWFIVYFDGLNGEQVSFHHYGSEDIRPQLAELAEVLPCGGPPRWSSVSSGGGFGRCRRRFGGGLGMVSDLSVFVSFGGGSVGVGLTLGGVDVSNLSCFVSFESILVSFSHFFTLDSV